jgi:hypothetical protein
VAECAPADILERFEDVVSELFSEVIGMSYYDCLVTDESCLCDFITEDTPVDYQERFRQKYGFELATVHTRIADLARAIAHNRATAGAVS